jgi:hypothetical protein
VRRGTRWALSLQLFLATICVLGVLPAADATGSNARLPAQGGIRAGPATPGEQLWVKRYNGPLNAGNGSDGANALGVSPDGSAVFVTGESAGPTSNSDYATLAHNASTGSLLWVRRYNGPGNGYDSARALGVSPDGSKVFVTGVSYGGSTSSLDYATVAYEASTGAQLWVRRYKGPGNGDDQALALGVSSDGSKVFVTGVSYGAASSDDYATAVYLASSGSLLWVRRYNGPGNSLDTARALAVSPDGSTVFVTGGSFGSSGPNDYATLAYDVSGNLLWVSRYDGPGEADDLAVAMGVSPDGATVLVTGCSWGSTSAPDYATIANKASAGTQLWVGRYNGPGNRDDFAYALGVSPDGSKVFVTGSSFEGSTTSYDYATVVYNVSTGTQLWVARYDPGNRAGDHAYALGVSADGSKVFVTGRSYGSMTSDDYASVAYDTSTGGQLWVSRYIGPYTDDFANALGVSPDGSKVFVTGVSNGGPTRSYDYATVTYSAT